VRAGIGARVVAGVTVVIASTVTATTWFFLRAEEAARVAQLEDTALQLSDTIKSSMQRDMMNNHRERLQEQIENVGRQQGIHAVRVLNKEGRIAFSSDPSEVGRQLPGDAETCRACHTPGRPQPLAPASATRVVRLDNERVLAVTNPIANAPSCATAACHAHPSGRAVLGVLDVDLSLAGFDRTADAARRRATTLATAATVVSGVLLWWLVSRFVLRPVDTLAEAPRRVADGDLAVEVPVTGGPELAELAHSFNEMTRRLRDAQQQLTQADKLAAVGRMAAGIAHEINNPLTAVLTYASFWEKRSAENVPLRQDLEVVVRETKRCRDIVKGLLDFSRQTPPRRERIDVNEVVRRAAAVTAHPLEVGRIALTLRLAPDLHVFADANQLQQVVVNLLLNAADAIASDGTGRLEVVTQQQNVAPWGHEPIRRAACPKGCDLLDPAVRIAGHPALRVLRACGSRESVVQLDPVYGGSRHTALEPCKDGTVCAFSCPRCRASLMEDRRCDRCGSPCFAAVTVDAQRVIWCARADCRWSHWDERERSGPTPMVEVVVEDNGTGIAADDQAKLFEPFFTTKGTRGTGLGLAVTWGIVQAHGGDIEVDSQVARGTRFTVRLPVTAGVVS
jgi:two-component system, NtrC family, sensor kinase